MSRYKKKSFLLGKQIISNARKEQLEGIKFIDNKFRVLLADSMGSGKTLQTIGSIQNMLEYNPNAKILIITPASIGSHWVAEFDKWAPEIKKVHIYTGLQQINYLIYNVFIISYGLILPGRSKYLEIVNINWDFVIADESHAFRNRDTLTSIYIAPILERAPKVLLISGTPQTSRPEQLFIQYSILFPGEMTFEQFAITFCNGYIDKNGKLVTRGFSNLDLLNKKLKDVMLRRHDNTMRPTLMRIKVSFQVQKTPYYIALQNKLSNLMKSPASAGDISQQITDTVSKLYQETGIIKSANPQIMSFIINIVRKNYELSGHKTLIFAHHDIVRQRVENALRLANIPYNAIDGKVPAHLRLNLVNQVANMNTKIVCSVCSITACSTGLSFVPGVNVIIFLEYTWNISDQLQAEARVARYGSNVPVVYAYYIHAGSLYDRRLLMNLKDKYIVNRKSIDNDIELDIGKEPGFIMNKEIEYRPNVYAFDKFDQDSGRLEIEDLNGLKRELGLENKNIDIKELDKKINEDLFKIDLQKDEYEQ